MCIDYILCTSPWANYFKLITSLILCKSPGTKSYYYCYLINEDSEAEELSNQTPTIFDGPELGLEPRQGIRVIFSICSHLPAPPPPPPQTWWNSTLQSQDCSVGHFLGHHLLTVTNSAELRLVRVSHQKAIRAFSTSSPSLNLRRVELKLSGSCSASWGRHDR